MNIGNRENVRCDGNKR